MRVRANKVTGIISTSLMNSGDMLVKYSIVEL